MKISFRESDGGLKNKIYLDGELLGYVEINLWNRKWTMVPHFNFSPFQQAILCSEHESAYKAGKALVELYSDTFLYKENILDDTQELDMRGIFKQRGP